MKEDSKIIDNFKNKIKILKKHNQSYYAKDNPTISDAEYDIIKKELLALEKNIHTLKKLPQ